MAQGSSEFGSILLKLALNPTIFIRHNTPMLIESAQNKIHKKVSPHSLY